MRNFCILIAVLFAGAVASGIEIPSNANLEPNSGVAMLNDNVQAQLEETSQDSTARNCATAAMAEPEISDMAAKAVRKRYVLLLDPDNPRLVSFQAGRADAGSFRSENEALCNAVGFMETVFNAIVPASPAVSAEARWNEILTIVDTNFGIGATGLMPLFNRLVSACSGAVGSNQSLFSQQESAVVSNIVRNVSSLPFVVLQLTDEQKSRLNAILPSTTLEEDRIYGGIDGRIGEQPKGGRKLNTYDDPNAGHTFFGEIYARMNEYRMKARYGVHLEISKDEDPLFIDSGTDAQGALPSGTETGNALTNGGGLIESLTSVWKQYVPLVQNYLENAATEYLPSPLSKALLPAPSNSMALVEAGRFAVNTPHDGAVPKKNANVHAEIVKPVTAAKKDGKWVETLYKSMRGHPGIRVPRKNYLATTTTGGDEVPYSELPYVRIKGAQTVENAPSWGLDRLDQRQLPLNKEFRYTDTGNDVDIYVLDSGLRSTHQEFTGRVVPGRNFAPDQDPTDTDDCNGHGTHVTSLAAGSTYGVAKQATIIPVRVYDCSNSGPLSQALNGIDWTLARIRASGRRSVVNMSFGGPSSQALNNAVNRLTEAGAAVVVAAGNDSSDACNVSPANSRDALTVGASSQDDSYASYSNEGKCVDIVAPGTNIVGAGIASDTATRTLTGTSMATPFTAGIVATALQADPNLSPRDALARVQCAATPNVVRHTPSGTTSRLAYAPPNGWASGVECTPESGAAAAATSTVAVAIAVLMTSWTLHRQYY